MMDGRMQKDHRQRLKDKVFDGSGFYVTELSPSSRLFPRANPNNFNTFVREIIPGSTLVQPFCSCCSLRLNILLLSLLQMIKCSRECVRNLFGSQNRCLHLILENWDQRSTP